MSVNLYDAEEIDVIVDAVLFSWPPDAKFCGISVTSKDAGTKIGRLLYQFNVELFNARYGAYGGFEAAEGHVDQVVPADYFHQSRRAYTGLPLRSFATIHELIAWYRAVFEFVNNSGAGRTFREYKALERLKIRLADSMIYALDDTPEQNKTA